MNVEVSSIQNSYELTADVLFRHEMQHFVHNLEGYLSNQILNVTWSEFQEGLLNVGELRTRFEFNITLYCQVSDQRPVSQKPRKPFRPGRKAMFR